MQDAESDIGFRTCVVWHEAALWIAHRSFAGPGVIGPKRLFDLWPDHFEDPEFEGRIALANELLLDRVRIGKIRLYARYCTVATKSDTGLRRKYRRTS
jgi:hypothetical protein